MLLVQLHRLPLASTQLETFLHVLHQNQQVLFHLAMDVLVEVESGAFFEKLC